jgi:hypothetical protein
MDMTLAFGDGAWVMMHQANQALHAGDYERGIELGLQARGLAEQLGSEEALSEALTWLGTARVQHGDRYGLEDLTRSIETATRAGALGALSGAYNDLAAAYQRLGDLDAGYAARVEGARVAERVGSASNIRWFQGALTDALYRRDEWDDAVRKGDDFLRSVDQGSPHYLTWQVAAIRAEIRLPTTTRLERSATPKAHLPPAAAPGNRMRCAPSSISPRSHRPPGCSASATS